MNKLAMLIITHLIFVAFAALAFYYVGSAFLAYLVGVIAGTIGANILNE